jgi:hypothetical protein
LDRLSPRFGPSSSLVRTVPLARVTSLAKQGKTRAAAPSSAFSSGLYVLAARCPRERPCKKERAHRRKNAWAALVRVAWLAAFQRTRRLVAGGAPRRQSGDWPWSYAAGTEKRLASPSPAKAGERTERGEYLAKASTANPLILLRNLQIGFVWFFRAAALEGPSAASGWPQRPPSARGRWFALRPKSGSFGFFASRVAPVGRCPEPAQWVPVFWRFAGGFVSPLFAIATEVAVGLFLHFFGWGQIGFVWFFQAAASEGPSAASGWPQRPPSARGRWFALRPNRLRLVISPRTRTCPPNSSCLRRPSAPRARYRFFPHR